MTFRRLLSTVAVVGICLDHAPVQAFSQPSYYARDAALGGGGGRWFTGTAVDGYTCAVCHTGEGSWTLHVEGLPAEGYVPGTRYDVRITWPEFTARADLLRAQMPLTANSGAVGAGPELAGPDMSMLAELTTSQGETAGQLEMDYQDIAAEERRDEWCLHLEGVPASQLFDTGSPAPDQPTLSCAPTAPGQRCVLAVQVCGARMLRFGWVAPEQPVSPVWFNAGMVATEALNADSSHDAVTFVRQPIYPAASAGERYVEQIDHGCTLSGPRRRAPSAQAYLICAAMFCAWLRNRNRSRKSNGGHSYARP